MFSKHVHASILKPFSSEQQTNYGGGTGPKFINFGQSKTSHQKPILCTEGPRASQEICRQVRTKMGERFYERPFLPRPWEDDWQDEADEADPTSAPEHDQLAERKRQRKQSIKGLEMRAAEKAQQRASKYGWCYGSFDKYSGVKANGTLAQGWLRIPCEVRDYEAAPSLSCRFCSRTLGTTQGLTLHMKACKQRPAEEDDRGEALFKDFDNSAFLADMAKAPLDRAEATLDGSADGEKHNRPISSIQGARGPKPHTIDVGDYYMTATMQEQVLRIIGTLMAADKL